MADRTLKVEIVGDASSLNKAFGKAADSGDRLGSTFKSLGKAGAYAGVALGGVAVAGAFKAVSAASDLNESMNAVNVTFGKSAEIVTDFGKNAAQRTGLSMRELNESVVPIGASLQNMGASANDAAKTSINLAKRAADMASVFNTSVGEALTAVQAGLRGESDPLERFGVGLSAARVEAYALSSGLIKTKSELTDQVKVQARVGLLMKDSAKFAGDFANTSDGLANSQRILKAEIENAGAAIGTALLPVATKVVGVLADMVPKAVEVGSVIAGKVGPALSGLVEVFKTALPTIVGFIKPVVDVVRNDLMPIFEQLKVVATTAIQNIGDVIRSNAPQLRTIFENLGTVISNLAKIVLPILEIAFTKILPAALKVLIPALVITTTAMAKLSDIARITAQVITAVLRPVIAALIPVVTGVASAFTSAWGKVSAAVQAAWRVIGPIVNGIKAIIVGMVNAVVGVLTGDWARAWSGLKQAAMGGWNVFKAWLLGLPAAVAGWAAQIGVAIIRGIASGMAGAVPALLSEAGNIVGQVKDKLEFWHSPPESYGRDIGHRLIGKEGLAGGIADKAGEAAKAATDAVTKAKQAVEQATGDFASAFQNLASQALSAFDAAVSQWQPKSQIRLDKLHAKEELAQLKKDISDATSDVSAKQTELQAALAGGDPEAIKTAQQAVTDAIAQAASAQRALRDYNLEQQAQAEQAAHDKRMARQRIHLQNELEQVQAWLAKHPEQYKKAQEKVNAVLKQAGVDAKLWGTSIGIALADGLKDAEGAVKDAAEVLARAIARVLKTRSPAEEGPMSDLDQWWSSLVPTLVSGLDVQGVKNAGTMLAQGFKDSLGVPVTSSVGVPSANVAGVVGGGAGAMAEIHTTLELDGTQIAEVIRREYLRFEKRNGRAAL